MSIGLYTIIGSDYIYGSGSWTQLYSKRSGSTFVHAKTDESNKISLYIICTKFLNSALKVSDMWGNDCV